MIMEVFVMIALLKDFLLKVLNQNPIPQRDVGIGLYLGFVNF